MDKKLNFYNVNIKYISYLHKYDKRVPKVDYSNLSDHDKFMCGIVLKIGDFNYFAPISSFKTPQRTNVIIKDSNGTDVSSIRFSFMIPIPHSLATLKHIKSETSPKYRNLLDMELQFCLKNASAIFNKAKFVYDSVTVKKDPLMIKNCCNFKLLEEKCREYERMSEAPPAVLEKVDDLVNDEDWDL